MEVSVYCMCQGSRSYEKGGGEEEEEASEGGVGFVRMGAVPRRLCSSGSIIDWLVFWQEALQKIRQKNTMRREVTVELSSQGFWKTGIRSDVCQVTPVNCVCVCVCTPANTDTSIHTAVHTHASNT